MHPPGASSIAASLHPEVFAVAALLAAAWLHALRARRQRLPRARGLMFLAGLGVAVAALNGPLHDLAEHRSFAAHMAQHLVLTLLTPPLLLAGTPGWMLDRLVAPLVARPATRAPLACLTRPLPALALHATALFFWHLPGPYDAALGSRAAHAAQHLTLLVTALGAWWPVLSPSRLLPALPYAGRILYLFVFGVPMTVVAAMVTGADHLLYRFYGAAPRPLGLDALTDQRLGGVIMWVPAGIIPLVAFTIVFFRWVAAEPDDAGDLGPPVDAPAAPVWYHERRP